MEAFDRLMPALMAVIAVVGIFAAVALWRIAGETGERACIEAAQAKYPAVSVSAFVTRNRADSGPLKLSFEKERQREVDKCD
jgi:type II secretory pathway pseudopilin PulG